VVFLVEEADQKENQLIMKHIINSLESKRMQLSTRSRNLIEKKPLRCTQIKVEIQKNSRLSHKHMRSLAIETKENFMTKVVSKLFNKVEVEAVVAMATSSPKCSEEVEVEEDIEVHNKVKVFNIQSKLLSKKSIRVRLPKLQ